MNKGYQVTIEGRVFEGHDPRALLKKAVEVKRRLDAHRRCRHCGKVVQEPFLAEYQLCFGCVDQAVVWYTEALIARFRRRTKTSQAWQCESRPLEHSANQERAES